MMVVRKLKILFLLIFLLATASAVTAQEIEWGFPKPGMATKMISGERYYDLGNEFYARHEIHNGRQIAIVLFRSDLDAIIDTLNLEQPGGVPNKEQFMTAVAAEKALAGVRGEARQSPYQYLGSGKLDGRNVYLYKARNGAIVGVAISDDKTLAIVMPQKESTLIAPIAPNARPTPAPAPRKTCIENGHKIPCP